MKKFILLGMTALALVFSQNSNATDFITTPKLQQELNQAVQHLDSKGFLKSKIDVLSFYLFGSRTNCGKPLHSLFYPPFQV